MITAWKCPKCGAILAKSEYGLASANVAAMIIGTATCLSCGARYSQTDVYGGKFDVPESTPPAPSNMSGSSETAAVLLVYVDREPPIGLQKHLELLLCELAPNDRGRTQRIETRQDRSQSAILASIILYGPLWGIRPDPQKTRFKTYTSGDGVNGTMVWVYEASYATRTETTTNDPAKAVAVPTKTGSLVIDQRPREKSPMTKQRAEESYRQASDYFRRGKYEKALLLLCEIDQAFPNRLEIAKTKAACESKLAEPPREGGIAFIAGQLFTELSKEWVAKKDLSEKKRNHLLSQMSELDRHLQSLGLPFLFEGATWPDEFESAKYNPTSHLDQTSRIREAFYFGVTLRGMRNVLSLAVAYSQEDPVGTKFRFRFVETQFKILHLSLTFGELGKEFLQDFNDEMRLQAHSSIPFAEEMTEISFKMDWLLKWEKYSKSL
jgi:hypothetical protein